MAKSLKGTSRTGISHKIGLWEMLRDVLIASMNKGQFPLALAGLGFIAVVWKMPEKEVGALASQVVADLKGGYLVGYVLAVFLAIGWFMHAKWQRKMIHEEMKRIAKERTQVQQKALGDHLPSSENKR